tara:strand:+ start:6999 stop:7760 length:762 start_codon:yes stop_codon:yes gene_type:complete
MNELFMLKEGVLRDKNKKEREAESKAAAQRIKNLVETAVATGLTFATGGAGLPALLSKIPALGKVIKGSKTLTSIAKFLNAAQKTSRAGVYGTNILNNLIHRGVADLIIPDVDRGSNVEQKVQGYLADVAAGTTAYAGSFMPDAAHPWTGEKWSEVVTGGGSGASSKPLSQAFQGIKDVNNDGTVDILDVIASQQSSQANVPTPDPRQTINVSGGTFATTPNTRQGLFGSQITQKPSGYKDGNPYYTLKNTIK